MNIICVGNKGQYYVGPFNTIEKATTWINDEGGSENWEWFVIGIPEKGFFIDAKNIKHTEPQNQ